MMQKYWSIENGKFDTKNTKYIQMF